MKKPLIRMEDVLTEEKPTPEELAEQQGSESPDASEVNPDQVPPSGGEQQPPPMSGPPAQPGQPAPPDGGQIPAQPQQAPQGDPGAAPTEQEQQAYEQVVIAAGKIIYEDQQSHAKIMQALQQGAQNPTETLAMLTVSIMKSLDEQSGNKIPQEVIAEASGEILTQLAELANSAGVFQVDEKMLQQAAQMMLAQLADAYGESPEAIAQFIGKFKPEEVEQMRSSQNEIANGGAEAQTPGMPPQGGQAMPPDVPPGAPPA
jgi:hypothetical protein